MWSNEQLQLPVSCLGRLQPTATPLASGSSDQLSVSGTCHKPAIARRKQLASLLCLTFLVGIIMEKEVQPNFVLLSPYAFQNSKKVELIAKHGSLLLAVIFLTCLTLCYFNSKIWALFLPQVVFYVSTYTTGCISDNKGFQLIQILITSILFPYSYGLKHLTKNQFELSYIVTILLTCTAFAMILQFFVLHIKFRKHFVHDLSVPQSVSRLNMIDFCNSLFFIVCFFSAFPLSEMMKTWFPSDTNPTHSNQEVSVLYFNGLKWYIIAADFVIQISFLVASYIYVTFSNRSKSMISMNDVEFDCYDQAWFSMSHHFALAFLTVIKGCCRLLFFPYWCCISSISVRQNRSIVKPVDALKLDSKFNAERNV